MKTTLIHCRNLTCLVLAGVLSGCASTVHVTKVDAMTRHTQGVYFALPRTVITVEIPVTNVVRTPGRFADSAVQFGIAKEPVTVASTNFDLGTPVVSTTSEPDPDNVYRVEVEGGYFEDRSLQIELDESGQIVSGSSEAENKLYELSAQVAETGGSVLGKILQFGGKALAPTNTVKEYADLLDSIQTARFKILRLEVAGMNADAMKLALDELKTTAAAVTAEFAGKTVRNVWIAKFELRPRDVHQANFTLFNFSPSNGVSECISLTPVTTRFVDTKRSGTPVVLQMTPDYQHVLDSMPTNMALPKEHGFVYRYPATSLITVSNCDNLLSRSTAMIAQFGPVLSLPSSTQSKGSKQQVSFFKGTGGLSKVVVSSKSADPATVGKLGTAVKSVVEGDDELARLQRERQILEERKKIRDAKKALEN